MSDNIDLNTIKRNTGAFSFVDQLGSFINNYEFSKTFRDFKLGKDNKYTNIWSAISALGNDYAEVIYSNVIDYIDNVSNVDLCKIKALKSMIAVLGVDYQIVTDMASMPVEILNLMDILSINKHYLLDNKTFCEEFKQQLSVYNDGACILSSENHELSNEISADISSYATISSYLDNDAYKDFLYTIYYKTLEKYVKLQYADAENGLSTQYKYIYEYIYEQLMHHNSVDDNANTNDAHKNAINDLKIKYRLYNFDYETIVDNIEDGRDLIDNYSEYQQAILSTEIDYRKSTYSYNLKEGNTQTYLSTAADSKSDGEAQIGYQLTRYSYYRERKVKEYFNFIETTYNSLIKSSQLHTAATNSTDLVAIDTYDKDNSYFLINDSAESRLLEYDAVEHQFNLNLGYISTIATLLAEQTLEISEIREQLKLQMQKTYIKGTFLLLSYIINEYLKFNIAKNFGDVTTDDGERLDDIINASIKDDENVQIIEYVDKTEYYNISTDFDEYIALCCNKSTDEMESEFAPSTGCNLAQNGKSLLNPKFWDRDSAKLGELTKDLPLAEIEDFYVKQLKLDEHGVKLSSDLVNFLSIIYLNGTPDTYVTEDTLNIVQKHTFSDRTVAPIITDVLSDHTYADFKSSYESITKDSIDLYYDSVKEALDSYQEQIDSIETSAIELTSQDKYQQYYNGYFSDLTCNPLYHRLSALSDFTSIAENIRSNAVISDILSLSVKYDSILSGIESLVDLSIHNTYWPLYSDNTLLEVDTRLDNIETYLKGKWTDDSGLLQHLDEHYQNLENYKQQIIDIQNQYNEAIAEFDSYVAGVEAGTGISLRTGKTLNGYSVRVWDLNHPIKEGDSTFYGTYSASVEASEPFGDTDTLREKLNKIQLRCQYKYYTTLEKHRHVISRETEQHYVDYGYVQPYLGYYIPTEAARILGKVHKCLDYFVGENTGLITMINTELKCLNSSEFPELDLSDVTEDNIEKRLEDVYNSLVKYQDSLKTNYIYSEIILSTDSYIQIKQAQNAIISAIVYDTNLIPNNIAYLDTEFDSIVEGVGKLLDENRTIFEKYVSQADKLYSEQISDMYEFILQYDVNSQSILLNSIMSMLNSIEDVENSIYSYLKGIYVYQADELNMFLTYSATKALLSEKLSPSAASYFARSDANMYADKLLRIFTSMAKYVYGSEANIRKYSESMIMEAKDATEYLSVDVLYYPSIAAQMLSYKQQITEICEDLDTLQTLNATFLKYSGTSNGEDPYTNIKNQTHSSYQIHPYLYNFVEYSNVAYPLANTFYISFADGYEKQLIDDKIDNIIGIYGNPINVAKYDYKLWNGYQSQYEYDQASLTKTVNNELQGFSGAFFKKAVFEFLDNTELFIQNVQDNTPDSYYYQLNLTQEELNKIAEQLRIYERPIREIVQRQKKSDPAQHCLSNEYDIYKYTEDYYGNSFILFKSYAYLYAQHADDPTYVPSYNEKKNTPGELWMRIKGHPIAFPAFDLRIESRDYTQYVVEPIPNMAGYELNGYIADINDYYAHVDTIESDNSQAISLQELTRDAISRSLNNNSQHTRFIFDIETDVLNQSLLLVVPYQTGTNHTKKNPQSKSVKWFTYSNSDIIVGYLTQEFDYDNNIHVYSFTKQSNINDAEGITNNIDNISRPSTVSQLGCYVSDGAGGFQPTKIQKETYDFIGFAKQDLYTYAVFVHKYYQRSNGTVIDSFVNQDAPKNRKPYMTIYYAAYFSSTIVKRSLSIPLKYDVYYPSEFDYIGSKADSNDFNGARNIILCGNSKYLTIAYVSESTQQAHTGTRKTYTDNTTIVNFAEYTATVEDKHDLSSYGQNIRYPADTAMLQTDDSQHINIYNSFDSFTSYIVAVELRYIGKYLKYNQVRYYNLNADAGYTPLLADVQGTSRLYNNSTLSKQTQYKCELLGPENSDVAYTPIIVDTGNTPDGRVTEDYKAVDKISYLNPEPITIPAHALSLEFSFDLKTVFGEDRHHESIYDQYVETGALSRYAYMLFNSSYEAKPIAVGYLNQQYPTSNSYLSSEKYDSLSGEEIIGPNGISYHNLQVGNHIDYISAIDAEIKFDNEKLPRYLNVSCYMRCELSTELIIPENKLRVLVYAKNNTMSYEYYHIIENAHSAFTSVKQDTIKKIDFSEISSLSSYSVDGIEPFKNKGGTKYSEMSANLEFKYSENRTIDREFPYLQSEDITDEVQSLNNDNQYIYFYALDSHKTAQVEPFKLYCYSKTSATGKMAKKINVKSTKYQDFFNQLLTIQTTYNVEIISGDELNPTYGIVLYFNYKNYTSPMYVKFKMSESKEEYPTYSYYTSTDPELKNTYLRLEPGQNGRLDIRVDFVEYSKKNPSDIQSIVIGCESKIIASYYIMNVSDDKPKFIISREPIFEE